MREKFALSLTGNYRANIGSLNISCFALKEETDVNRSITEIPVTGIFVLTENKVVFCENK